MGKTFKSALEKAPAENFINGAPRSDTAEKRVPEAVTHETTLRIAEIRKAETKTRRVQLLMRPSTYEALKAKAKREGDTLNNLINRVLEAYAND